MLKSNDQCERGKFSSNGIPLASFLYFNVFLNLSFIKASNQDIPSFAHETQKKSLIKENIERIDKLGWTHRNVSQQEEKDRVSKLKANITPIWFQDVANLF